MLINVVPPLELSGCMAQQTIIHIVKVDTLNAFCESACGQWCVSYVHTVFGCLGRKWGCHCIAIPLGKHFMHTKSCTLQCVPAFVETDPSSY